MNLFLLGNLYCYHHVLDGLEIKRTICVPLLMQEFKLVLVQQVCLTNR